MAKASRVMARLQQGIHAAVEGLPETVALIKSVIAEVRELRQEVRELKAMLEPGAKTQTTSTRKK